MLAQNHQQSIADFISECFAELKDIAPSNQPSKISLPLRNVSYTITIINALADVEILQTYENNTEQYLQVQYRFPINPNACLHKFTATFGQNRIQGVVKQKEEAKQEYVQAVKTGKKAGYGQISKQSKDIMTVQIGNIAPHQQVKIQIFYIEELTLSLNTFYKFDLPAKLYPRYTNSIPEPNYINSFRKKQLTISGDFEWNFVLKLSSSKTITHFQSHTHKLRLQNEPENQQKIITLQQGNTLLKDFSFIYTTEDFQLPSFTFGRSDKSSTAMVSFIPKFCSLSLEDALKASQIQKPQIETEMDSVKGQYIFLLDRSGSMSGTRIEKAKKALLLFIKSLPVDTYFNVISFGSNFLPLTPQSARNQMASVNKALEQIANYEADLGGTEIEEALHFAFSTLPVQEGYPKQLFLLTDGEVDNTQKVINLVRSKVKYARVHTIGIGDGASEALIKGCAQRGKGYHTFIKDDQNPSTKIIQLLNDSLTPVISNVTLNYQPHFVESIIPNPKSIPYILKGQVAHFYITFKEQLIEPTTIQLSYTDSLNKQTFTGQVQILPQKSEYPLVDKMGHFKSIQALEESEASGQKVEEFMYFVKQVDKKKQIIDLSVKHQILSKFTAFSCIQQTLQDNQYQQVQDKGQIKVNIGHSNTNPNPAAYSDDSQNGDEYVDECCYDQQAQDCQQLQQDEGIMQSNDREISLTTCKKVQAMQIYEANQSYKIEKEMERNKGIQYLSCEVENYRERRIEEISYKSSEVKQNIEQNREEISSSKSSEGEQDNQRGKMEIQQEQQYGIMDQGQLSNQQQQSISKPPINESARMNRQQCQILQDSQAAKELPEPQKLKKEHKNTPIIQSVINKQQVQGFWSDLFLLKDNIPQQTYNHINSLENKNVVITLLVLKFIQKYYPSAQYALIIKKANSWLKKQPQYADLQHTYANLLQ